ncbi:hypothetical protein BD324DRAFT_657049 [Kockovaella imperatae]|uniref:Telomeric single stranded DNA binding POT1/Cdc13 domain-containing protein n=1 Tax=Kockovaella imperatae TaxID=4999 RepID=A0A1Y1UDM1_9TREE|nr:hypothetical protein BD324DRAFT_657049 [Kockovaella imperatae]ORX36102.1 hypothetical protein BD324DRAFT_657049 [Kockovaella imperatae]
MSTEAEASMSRKAPFSSSRNVRVSDLKLDSVLPRSMHLTGTLMQGKSYVEKDPISGQTIQGVVKIQLRCELEGNASIANNYVSNDDQLVTPAFVNITISPNDIPPGYEDLTSMIHKEWQDSYNHLIHFAGRTISIRVDGMRVTGVVFPKCGMVSLEGHGEQIFQHKDRSAKVLLRDPVIHTSTPQWLASPSSDYIPSPEQPVASEITVKSAIPFPTADGLRPLSSHQIPKITMIPVPVSSTPSLSPLKRSDSSRSIHSKRSKSGTPPEDRTTEPSSTKRLKVEPSESVFKQSTGSSPFKLPPSPPVKAEVTSSPLKPDPSPHASVRSFKSAASVGSEPPLPRPMLQHPLDGQDSATRQSIPDTPTRTPESGPSERQLVSSPPPDRPRDISEAAESSSAARRKAAEKRARKLGEQRVKEKEAAVALVEAQIEKLKLPFTAAVHTYTPICMLQPHVKANTIGVVVETTQPRQTSRDYIMNIVIADPSTHIQGRSSEDFVVSVFRSRIEDLPASISPGTPILFRGLSISMYKQKPKGQAFGNETNTWAYLPGGKKLKTANVEDMVPALEPIELKRMEALFHWWQATFGSPLDEVSGRIDTPVGQSPRKDGYTLSRVRPNLFFDGVFKVLHVVMNERGGSKPPYELYISDGTVHQHPTRNFHNYSVPGLPPTAIFCLAIQDPDEASEETFKRGNVIKMRNLRVKDYKGELELAWANKVHQEQGEQGWRNKTCTLIDPKDDRVRVINTRINDLKNGKVPLPEEMPPPPVVEAQEPVVQIHSTMANNIGTTMTDEVTNPVSTLAKVKTNTLVPNRFRVQARVRSLHPRGLQKNATYLQKHCIKCNRAWVDSFAGHTDAIRSYPDLYCQSCNDTKLIHTRILYRFIAVLEQDNVILPIVIADDAAEDFLPCPPPVLASDNPNDLRKLMNRLRQMSEEVDHILLGPRQEGERVRPIIDWSIESALTKVPGKEEAMLVYRPFAMEQKPKLR